MQFGKHPFRNPLVMWQFGGYSIREFDIRKGGLYKQSYNITFH